MIDRFIVCICTRTYFIPNFLYSKCSTVPCVDSLGLWHPNSNLTYNVSYENPLLIEFKTLGEIDETCSGLIFEATVSLQCFNLNASSPINHLNIICCLLYSCVVSKIKINRKHNYTNDAIPANDKVTTSNYVGNISTSAY